jgi:hypothetical protein
MPRFATICAALRPLLASATPSASFLRRPNFVAANVSTNNVSNAANAVRCIGPTSAISMQMMPPISAAIPVAALILQTTNAKAALRPPAFTNCPGLISVRVNRRAITANSAAPAAHTSCRDCAASRSGEIAFCHRFPGISSAIDRPPPIVIYNQALRIANTVGVVLHLVRIEAESSTQSRPNQRSSRSVTRSAFGFALTAALLASAIGCGNNYRPVVSAFNPVGPAAQPGKYAVVISSTGATSPGIVTFVDFAGDTTLVTASIGVNPYFLILDSTGSIGYTLNQDTTISNFNINTSLISSQIVQTTLLPDNCPPASSSCSSYLPNDIFPQGPNTYITEPGRNAVAQFQIPTSAPAAGSPAPAPALQQEFQLDPAFNPIYITGIVAGPRVYVLSQSKSGGNGQVNTIETATNNLDLNPIPVGKNPVYGVMTADSKRVFVLNQGDGTVSVINSQSNQLDTVPSGSTNPITVGTAPVWADFAPTRNELIVANAGDGVSPGSVSIISIPLCSVTSLPSNPTCDPNNPVDASDFGTVLATIPVGVNPRMVGVLQDGTKAYVVNEGDPTQPCAAPSIALPLGNCTVTVINLGTNKFSSTIALPANPTGEGTATANGHPNYIAVTTGTPTGKVYITSPESNFMTVIRTDIDQVDTTIPLLGKGVSVRMSAP